MVIIFIYNINLAKVSLSFKCYENCLLGFLRRSICIYLQLFLTFEAQINAKFKVSLAGHARR